MARPLSRFLITLFSPARSRGKLPRGAHCRRTHVSLSTRLPPCLSQCGELIHLVIQRFHTHHNDDFFLYIFFYLLACQPPPSHSAQSVHSSGCRWLLAAGSGGGALPGCTRATYNITQLFDKICTNTRGVQGRAGVLLSTLEG